jgi:hypothetical protein
MPACWGLRSLSRWGTAARTTSLDEVKANGCGRASGRFLRSRCQCLFRPPLICESPTVSAPQGIQLESFEQPIGSSGWSRMPVCEREVVAGGARWAGYGCRG